MAEYFDVALLVVLCVILIIGSVHFFRYIIDEDAVETRNEILKLGIISFSITAALYGGYIILVSLFTSGFYGFIISLLLLQIFTIMVLDNNGEIHIKNAMHHAFAQMLNFVIASGVITFFIFIASGFSNFDTLATKLLWTAIYAGFNLLVLQNHANLAKNEHIVESKKINIEKISSLQKTNFVEHNMDKNNNNDTNGDIVTIFQDNPKLVRIRPMKKSISEKSFGLQRLSSVKEEINADEYLKNFSPEYVGNCSTEFVDGEKIVDDSSGYEEESGSGSDNFLNTDEENNIYIVNNLDSYKNSNLIRKLYQPARYSSHIPFYAVENSPKLMEKDGSQLGIQENSKFLEHPSESDDKEFRIFDGDNNNLFSDSYQTFATKSFFDEDFKAKVLLYDNDNNTTAKINGDNFSVKITEIRKDNPNYKMCIPVHTKKGH